MTIDFRLPTALFGGAFDPVHAGHLHVAREALRQRPDIKQLVFVPSAQSPGKKPSVASPIQRLEWLHLAALPEGFLVWNFEALRPGESFTVDTLEEAHRLGALQLHLLLGADAYSAFTQWRDPSRIRQLCRLLVANRPGHSVTPQVPADQFLSVSPHPASSTEIRAGLAHGDLGSPWLPGPVRAAMEKSLPTPNPYVRKI